jgi:basic membrane lipoprotein Med (substrate-binding protein (PBP1-ABC) superfamily)
MGKSSTVTRRRLIATAAAAGAVPLSWRSARATDKIKLAGIHAVPLENAWSSRVHAALTAAAKDGVIDYVYSESVATADYPRAVREYAEQGAQIIWGESYTIEADVRKVASEYPKIGFLMGSGGKPQANNFGVFQTYNHEAAYLAGVMAGKISKTGVFGIVGGYPIPEVNVPVNGFRLGVKQVRPDAKFLITYIRTWFDPAKAKEAATAQIDSGADILFGERIGTADGAQARNVLSIGNYLDYTPRYPKTVFANAVWMFRPIIDAFIADFRAGNPMNNDYSQFSLMKHGGNQLVYAKDLVTPEAVAAMEERKAAILSGTLEIPVDPSNPA